MTAENTMSGEPKSRRARQAAGWRHVKALVEPELYRQLHGIAGAYRLSVEQVTRDGLWYTVQQAPRDWWRGRAKAYKGRFKRRDAGRKRAKRGGGVSLTDPPLTPESK